MYDEKGLEYLDRLKPKHMSSDQHEWRMAGAIPSKEGWFTLVPRSASVYMCACGDYSYICPKERRILGFPTTIQNKGSIEFRCQCGEVLGVLSQKEKLSRMKAVAKIAFQNVFSDKLAGQQKP